MKKNYKLFLTLVLTICMVFTSTVTVFAGTISLDKTNAYISIGETLTLHLSNTKKNRTVYWRISDNSIATVNSKGVVKGVSEGTTVVTAKYRQKSYSCYLTVTQNRNTKELERLINEVISKSDKLGMSKADIIKLIDERIAKIPPTTIYVPSGGSPSGTNTPTFSPNCPFDYKDYYTNIIHFDSIKIDSVTHNDYGEFLKSTKTLDNRVYDKYTISMTLKGHVDKSLVGKTLYLTIAPRIGSHSNNTLIVPADGVFSLTYTCGFQEVPKEFYITEAMVHPGEGSI